MAGGGLRIDLTNLLNSHPKFQDQGILLPRRETGRVLSLFTDSGIAFSNRTYWRGNMRRRVVRGECWIHVFEETAFGGRGRLLGQGESAAIPKVRSMIVGPGAKAKVVSRRGREIMSLPPRRLVEDFSKLAMREPIAHVSVAKR
jgi:hypothetical protein